MKKSRFTEEQIAFALKPHEAGVTVAEITLRPGVSEQTFYRWRKKYGVLGKPTDNAFAEAFNARFRQECLNQD